MFVTQSSSFHLFQYTLDVAKIVWVIEQHTEIIDLPRHEHAGELIHRTCSVGEKKYIIH